MACQSVTWVLNDDRFTIEVDNSLVKGAGARSVARSAEKIYNLAGGYFRFIANKSDLVGTFFPGVNTIGFDDTMPLPDPDTENDYELEFPDNLGQFRIQEEVAGYGGPNIHFEDGDEFLLRIAGGGSKIVSYEKNGIVIRTSPNLANQEFYYVGVEATREDVRIPDCCFYANVWITPDVETADPGEEIEFTGHGGSGVENYEWSTDGGSLSAESGVEVVTWTAPLDPGEYTIELTDGESTWEVHITITSPPPELSFVPSYPIEIETRKNVQVSQSDTGARQSVTKSKSFRFYTLAFNQRKRAEYSAFETTWEGLYPNATFVWSHPVSDADGEFYFDSPVKWSPGRYNLLDYSVALKRKLSVEVSPAESNTLPFAPDYRYEGSPDKALVVSDSIDYSRKAVALSDKFRPFSLVFRSRSLDELLAMEQFWGWHYPGQHITFTEPVLNIEGDFWVDSNFKWRVVRENLVDYSFAIREV